MSSIILSRVSRTFGAFAFTTLAFSCSGSPSQTRDAATATAAAPGDSAASDSRHARSDSGPARPPADTVPSLRAGTLAVVLVGEDDVLSVRSGAGVGNAVVAELQPHTRNLIPTGGAEASGGQRWLEIRLPDGDVGWVNSYFITEQAAPGDFCDDARVDALLADFELAVKARDGPAFAALTSPHHGLVVRRHWWNPEVRYTRAEVASIFTARAQRDWGVADGTGFPITGSFDDVAVPLFDRLYAGTVTHHCNDIENGSGGSAGYRIWPFEYANINYYVLYRAASPAQELDWNTWAVGIEYVDGEPYVAFLVHYQWEI